MWTRYRFRLNDCLLCTSLIMLLWKVTHWSYHIAVYFSELPSWIVWDSQVILVNFPFEFCELPSSCRRAHMRCTLAKIQHRNQALGKAALYNYPQTNIHQLEYCRLSDCDGECYGYMEWTVNKVPIQRYTYIVIFIYAFDCAVFFTTSGLNTVTLQ